MSNVPALSTIRQIAISVRDVDAALRFYRDVLGLGFLFRPGEDLAFLDAGGVRLMLTTPEEAGAAGCNSVLYFTVSDIARAHAVLVERGAANAGLPEMVAKMPDHELWIAFVKDPDGNLVGVMEERR
jgi:catechol 2,3-dioxygenase-like lactoylglutathione lyase family enzyme